MATFSADGKAMKLLIFFPQEIISKQIDEAFPHEKANYAATASGWMETRTFCLFLDRFSEELNEK